MEPWSHGSSGGCSMEHDVLALAVEVGAQAQALVEVARRLDRREVGHPPIPIVVVGRGLRGYSELVAGLLVGTSCRVDLPDVGAMMCLVIEASRDRVVLRPVCTVAEHEAHQTAAARAMGRGE